MHTTSTLNVLVGGIVRIECVGADIDCSLAGVLHHSAPLCPRLFVKHHARTECSFCPPGRWLAITWGRAAGVVAGRLWWSTAEVS